MWLFVCKSNKFKKIWWNSIFEIYLKFTLHILLYQILDNDSYTLAEREQFPYYFNKREQRKRELLAHWERIEKDWDDQLASIQTELPKKTKIVQ